MSALSLPVRRLLAVALVVLAVVGLWNFGVRPLAAEFAAYRSSIARSESLLARYRRVGSAREGLSRRLEAARRAR